jgi:hypothetical protein
MKVIKSGKLLRKRVTRHLQTDMSLCILLGNKLTDFITFISTHFRYASCNFRPFIRFQSDI